MTFKLRRILYYILIICTFLWNQEASLLTQKITVENSYRDKVVSALSRFLGQENFIVIVNIEFSTIGKTLKKMSASKSGQGSLNGYTPIPGLPTVPSRDVSSSDTILKGRRTGENNYSIGRVEVNINLNEEVITEPIKQEIKSLVEKVIPKTRECEDCIKIESLGFLSIEKAKEIQELKDEIAEMKSAQRKAEEAILNKELAAVEERLKEVQNAKNESDKIIKIRDDELYKRETLEYERLLEFEKSRNTQDSIRNRNTENELKQVRDSKMRSDSTLLYKTMAIVEKQVSSDDDEKEESLLGMQMGSGGSSIMGSVIFILLIICLMIVTFLAASNKKPKPIYLKPKAKSKNNF